MLLYKGTKESQEGATDARWRSARLPASRNSISSSATRTRTDRRSESASEARIARAKSSRDDASLNCLNSCVRSWCVCNA